MGFSHIKGASFKIDPQPIPWKILDSQKKSVPLNLNSPCLMLILAVETAMGNTQTSWPEAR